MAPGTNPEATHRHEDDTAQGTLESYLESIAQARRIEGQQRSFSLSDDWTRAAFQLITEWVDEGLEFEPDDLRTALGPASSTGAPGAVINKARKAGLITSRGFTISRSPTRHGGVARRWGPA